MYIFHPKTTKRTSPEKCHRALAISFLDCLRWLRARPRRRTEDEGRQSGFQSQRHQARHHGLRTRRAPGRATRRLGASSPPGHRRRAQSSRIIAQPGRHNNIHAVCIEKDAKLPNEFNLSSSGPHLAMSVGRCVFCPCVFNLTPMVSKGRIPSAAKAASGRNAITHGLTASAPVMRRVETPRNLGPSSRAGSSPA